MDLAIHHDAIFRPGEFENVGGQRRRVLAATDLALQVSTSPPARTELPTLNSALLTYNPANGTFEFKIESSQSISVTPQSANVVRPPRHHH